MQKAPLVLLNTQNINKKIQLLHEGDSDTDSVYMIVP